MKKNSENQEIYFTLGNMKCGGLAKGYAIAAD